MEKVYAHMESREPKLGLLMLAVNDFNIDLSQSIMIGDSERDVEAGKNAGCKESVLVESNQSDSLLVFVKYIINIGV